MADIKPFRAYRYQLNQPSDLGAHVAPPYDMMDAALIENLYASGDSNVVRVIQNRPEPADKENADRHRRGAETYRRWMHSGRLVQDDSDSIYIYRQRFSAEKDGETVTLERTGVTVLVRLVDFSEGIVFPHENTLSGPKRDRYELLSAVKSHTELIFGLVPDEGELFEAIRRCAGEQPVGVFSDVNGVVHELHRNSDGSAARKLRELMAARTILIADGHHRYETALKFSRDTGDPRHAYVLMTLVSMADPGLIIRPFHRVARRCPLSSRFSSVSDLSPYFDIEDKGPATLDLLHAYLSGALNAEFLFIDSRSRHGFGLSTSAAGAWHLQHHGGGLSELWNNLNVSKINRFCVEGVMHQPLDGAVLHDVFDYVNSASAAFNQALDESKSQGCFFLRPIGIDTVRQIVSQGERMPQKSTNFYPKLYSGLLFHTME